MGSEEALIKSKWLTDEQLQRAAECCWLITLLTLHVNLHLYIIEEEHYTKQSIQQEFLQASQQSCFWTAKLELEFICPTCAPGLTQTQTGSLIIGRTFSNGSKGLLIYIARGWKKWDVKLLIAKRAFFESFRKHLNRYRSRKWLQVDRFFDDISNIKDAKSA